MYVASGTNHHALYFHAGISGWIDLVTAGGGGGGAGGMRSSFPGGQKIILNPGSNAVTIGAGGTAASQDRGGSGTDSRIGYITATGGGGGGLNLGTPALT